MSRSSDPSEFPTSTGLFGLLENLFDDIDKAAAQSLRRTSPAVNFIEGTDHFRYELAAPGLQKKDFKVELKDNLLVVSTEKDDDSLAADEQFHRREFTFYRFKRAFDVPKSADPNAIKARYERGVLTLTLPKRKEAQIESRVIDIS